MKRALISDVHANSEPCKRSLEDIRQQGVTKIYCLGDIIGYGPNPCECLDQIIKHCAVTILGNHDQAALFDPDGFNPVALQAVYWTREQLERRETNADLDRSPLGFPRQSAALLQRGRFSLRARIAARAHQMNMCSPRMFTTSGRSTPGSTHSALLAFRAIRNSGRFTQSGEFITPDECNYVYPLTGEKTMFNVGSVGQASRQRSALVLRHHP